MMSPTIGRRLWYWPSAVDLVSLEPSESNPVGRAALYRASETQAFDSGVVYVHDDRSVTLDVADHGGQHQPRHQVQLLQDDDVAPEGGGHAQWMPSYQVGQAAKVAEPPAQHVDPLLDSARVFVISSGDSSHEGLMRHYDVNREVAEEWLVELEKLGVVGPEAGGVRPVLIKP